MNEDYKALLANPKWQKRRLEIMQAARFACQICNDTSEELHVHHLCYRNHAVDGNRLDPWEYKDDEMLCLCNTCHKLMHIQEQKLIEFLLYTHPVPVTDYAAAAIAWIPGAYASIGGKFVHAVEVACAEFWSAFNRQAEEDLKAIEK